MTKSHSDTQRTIYNMRVPDEPHCLWCDAAMIACKGPQGNFHLACPRIKCPVKPKTRNYATARLATKAWMNTLEVTK